MKKPISTGGQHGISYEDRTQKPKLSQGTVDAILTSVDNHITKHLSAQGNLSLLTSPGRSEGFLYPLSSP